MVSLAPGRKSQATTTITGHLPAVPIKIVCLGSLP
jgi:hypothetical protein